MLLKRLSDDSPRSDIDLPEADNKSDGVIDDIILLLSSRPRCDEAEGIPLVKASVMNYGVRDTFSSDTPDVIRNSVMQERIELALLRFEPRLRNTLVYSDNHENHTHCFVIEADTDAGPVCYRVMWDDILSHFSLSE